MSETGRRWILFFATLAQLIVAILLIYYVRKLSDVSFNTDTQEVEEMSCALNAGTHTDPTGVAGDLEDESLCVLAYSGASITLFAMFALSVLLCFTCNLCGVGWLVEVVVQGILSAGWVIYASWVTDAAKTIDGWENVPEWDTDSIQNARSTVVALSWAEAVLTGLVAVVILSLACCNRDRGSSKRGFYNVGDEGAVAPVGKATRSSEGIV